jgi:hypothetical protein
MTTHDLAKLLDHLRDGLTAGLTSTAIKDLTEASEAIRELPDMPLKTFARDIKPKPPKAGGKKGQAAVDLPGLIERIRAVKGGTGTAESVLQEVEQLSSTQLKDVLKAFNLKGTSTKDGNLARTRALLLGNDPATAPSSNAPNFDPALVESGVQLYLRLRDSRDLGIEEVRAQFEPIRFYPKPVVEEISRRVGYTPDGSRDAIARRLLSNLESIKMHQLRSDLILSGN